LAFFYLWIKIYDIAASVLILTEAGGMVTDWEGNQFKSDSPRIVASNRKIHNELLKELKG
jgi:myo-inositol-1(or 4)-monophosphatase